MIGRDILGAARAHFDAMRNRVIEVPEWGQDGAPLRIHHDPLTMRDRQRLEAAAKGSDALAAILVVIRHAKDAAGARLFEDNAESRKALENDVDPAVIGRIAKAIIGVSDSDSLGE